ncbi:MAG: class I SAM-dependent methyltransferase [Gammaproteobacteria bacterium]|nr:class I SAM-dependent methyltransferase [Gammaproteobacteria bacterium]MDH5302978.1 class I SAM-dependent methyltransferase [Gammaproteobacteria bacterium]MDH5321275.1 class I SAM-dependent methyltransferase [Gammaproteobacteria bacterium]
MRQDLAAHIARNSQPIAEVLGVEFGKVTDVLEIGSGSGQHATLFATAFPQLQWQTSDLDENHSAINAWIAREQLPNVLPPLSLDVMTAKLPANSYDAVFSANTAHIMPIAAVEQMFAVVSTVLRAGGVFFLYGPFRQDLEFNAESNARFHETLQARDRGMGIRDLEKLEGFATVLALDRLRCYAMPANNLSLLWLKRDGSVV